MKSLVKLLEILLADAGRKCIAPYRRDIITVSRRVEYEGDSFITITLPRFGQVFERALDQGRLSPSDFGGLFSRPSKSACLPSFLKGFMSQVFDSTGRLLDEPSSDCILAIRQICYLAKKIQRPCTSAREKDSEKAFIKCEDEVNNDPSGPLWDTYKSVCKIVMSSICSGSMYEELVPRNGPGTTAERIMGNQKYVHRTWHDRLEKVFPYTEFGMASLRNLDDLDHVMPNFVDPSDELPVRVVFVPKTMKTPRVIAIEPVCMQYAQQALLNWIVPRIESGKFTSGRVNFSRQDINQSIAAESSRSGKFATLDLSEASDRVSLAMARALYSVDPNLWDLVDACRSRRAELPSGRVIDLKKFASMGSALCFPTEALTFFCVIVASRMLRAKAPLTARFVKRFSKGVYVYGDDIIVPTDEAISTCVDLEAFGLKVNRNKSFWTGKFRESCGAEYYDGRRCTPVYLRRDIPSRRSDSNGVLSSVSTSNQLFDAGFSQTSAAIKDAVERLVGKFPTVQKNSPAIGWTFYSDYVPPSRYNDSLQRIEFRCRVVVPSRRADPLSGDAALAKCFGLISQRDISTDHLLRTVGRGRLALKPRWVSI